MWSSNLGLNDRDRHGKEAYTQTLDGTTRNERSEVWCKHLNESGEEVDEGSDSNTLLATDHVSETSGNERTQGCGELQGRD